MNNEKHQKMLELVMESRVMGETLVALKRLRKCSDGVVINDRVVTWDEAMPIIDKIPDFPETEQATAKWMLHAQEAWISAFNQNVQRQVKTLVGKNSTIENDNLFLSHVFTKAHFIISLIVPYVDNTALVQEQPNTATALQELLNILVGVTEGVISTKQIREEIYLSGFDDALMALHEQLKKASQRHDVIESDALIKAITIIRTAREAGLTFLHSDAKVN